jgi:hypothetical protein
VLQKFRDPLTVFRICLASWNSFDVLCVGQQDLKVTFENVPHWLPINACGLHGDMLNAEPLQPRHQLVEFACCTSEAAICFCGLPDCASKIQAVMDDLCTSSPQHRGYRTSMAISFRRAT